MRRPTKPTHVGALLSVVAVAAGCGSTVQSNPKQTGVNVASTASATPAPTTPPPLPFRLPCGETDFDGCTKGCEDRVVEDCTTLGIIYYEGKGIDANTSRGVEIFRSACLEDSARACIRLADLYHNAVLIDDPAAEAVLYTRACEAGANRGCLGAGRAYLEAKGVERNPSFAAKFFARVCDRGNADSCLELAHLHARGEGVKKDQDLAMRLYTKACQLGSTEACVTADPKGEGEVAPRRE